MLSSKTKVTLFKKQSKRSSSSDYSFLLELQEIIGTSEAFRLEHLNKSIEKERRKQFKSYFKAKGFSNLTMHGLGHVIYRLYYEVESQLCSAAPVNRIRLMELNIDINLLKGNIRHVVKKVNTHDGGSNDQSSGEVTTPTSIFTV